MCDTCDTLYFTLALKCKKPPPLLYVINNKVTRHYSLKLVTTFLSFTSRSLVSTLRENGFDSSEFVVRAGAPRGGGPFRDNYTGAVVLVAASRSIRFHATGRLKFCTEERATPMRKECAL